MKAVNIIIAVLFTIVLAGCGNNEEPKPEFNFKVEGNVVTNDIYTYVGEHKNGTPHGRGIQIYYYGEKVIGTFENGCPKDVTIYYPDGRVYNGQFENCFMSYGYMKYPDGSFYKGEWYEDKPHGQGVMRMADGTMYIGTFKDGYPYEAKEVPAGCLEGDCYTGKSLLVKDGVTYAGNFRDGMLHDTNGTITWPDGSYYRGGVVDNLPHGYGVKVTAEYTAEGKWRRGELLDGTVRYKDGRPDKIFMHDDRF